MNFRSLHYFLGIKTIKKRFKNHRTVLGRNRPVATVAARRPAMRDRPEGHLGHGLAARILRARRASCGVITAREMARWRAHRRPSGG
jgi:hypothetical protein